jgi:hypothetical protein
MHFRALESVGWYWDNMADPVVGDSIFFSFSNPSFPTYSLEMEMKTHWAELKAHSDRTYWSATTGIFLSLLHAEDGEIANWNCNLCFFPDEIEKKIKRHEESLRCQD